MSRSLSIFEKQELGKGSKDSLNWEVLDSVDRRIVMAVCCDGFPETARKNLNMSIGGFYKRWKYLKSIYNSLLNEVPNQAVSMLKVYSTKAAETLARNLEADHAADQIKAANSILDRVTPEREDIQFESRKRINFEEWLIEPKNLLSVEDTP